MVDLRHCEAKRREMFLVVEFAHQRGLHLEHSLFGAPDLMCLARRFYDA